MFQFKHLHALQTIHWAPRPDFVQYVEAIGYSEEGGPFVQKGILQDSEVRDWLNHEGEFALPALARNKISASSDVPLRLLLCERGGWIPLAFPLSREAYHDVKSTFGFGDQVLTAFSLNNGQCHIVKKALAGDDKRFESIDITIKLPQMYQLGNAGLALTHVFREGTTRAMMHGWNLCTDKSHGDRRKVPQYIDRFMASVHSAYSSWSHPLLLPVILLDEHIAKGEDIKQEIFDAIEGISASLGVTASGRLAMARKITFDDIRRLIADPQSRMNLTATLNTTITNATTCSNVLRWNKRYRESLAKCFSDIESSLEEGAKDGHRELLEYFTFLDAQADELLDIVDTLKTKLDLQLSVLYNFVAQVDNDLNKSVAELSFQVAHATGLDSTAMKVLAIVTVVFLPPSFIATLFSMSMFDWQSAGSVSDNDSSQIVASNFWIYWATTVPLTLIILVAYRLWWRKQKVIYTEKYEVQTGQTEPTRSDFRSGYYTGSASNDSRSGSLQGESAGNGSSMGHPDTRGPPRVSIERRRTSAS